MPEQLQNWVEAYQELADLIKEQVPEVQWVDLWMEQTSTEEEEYPFPTPAMFLQFDANAIDEIGENEQVLNMNVTVLLAVDTLSDTYAGSANQADALHFGSLMRQIHLALHGKTGAKFGRLTRVGLRKEAAPPYVQLYSQVYATVLVDDSTAPKYQDYVLTADRQKLVRGTAAANPHQPPYQIP